MTDEPFAVILAAAGKSTRFGAGPGKIHAQLDGQPLWQYSVEVFASFSSVTQLLLVVSPEDRFYFEQNHAEALKKYRVFLVDGGAERFQSVENALKYVREEVGYVAIHDAARPCICRERVFEVFQAAVQTGAAVLAAPVVGTLKRANAQGQVIETVSRVDLWEAQTPQVFRKDLLLDAVARRNNRPVTDDAQLLEMAGYPVKIIPSARDNLKITTQNDLILAANLLKSRKGTP